MDLGARPFNNIRPRYSQPYHDQDFRLLADFGVLFGDRKDLAWSVPAG